MDNVSSILLQTIVKLDKQQLLHWKVYMSIFFLMHITIWNIAFSHLATVAGGLNLLAPKNDQHPISPYCIIPQSNIKVMKIEEMITN